MWLIILIIVCIFAVLICFSLAAAAKNAEELSQLWLENQSKKQVAPCMGHADKKHEI